MKESKTGKADLWNKLLRSLTRDGSPQQTHHARYSPAWWRLQVYSTLAGGCATVAVVALTAAGKLTSLEHELQLGLAIMTGVGIRSLILSKLM